MDFSIVVEKVIAFFITLCNVECTFAGFNFTVGSVFIWCGLVAIIAGFLKRGAG